MNVGRAMIDGVPRYVRIDSGLATPLRVSGLAVTGSLLEGGAIWVIPTDGSPVPISEVCWLAPVVSPGKVVAIGLNYVDHAAEASQQLPIEPLVFAKFPSSIIGPGAEVVIDAALTQAVDMEAELAVVIGRQARDISLDRAFEHVGAFTCLNDVSARDLQFRDGQWVRGKSLDTFCPIGPWLVQPDNFPIAAARIRGVVSGETLQDAVLDDMVFGVADLIARLSKSFALLPGDVIATGTPPGVGWFREPPRVLRDGDVMTVSIEGIGELTNSVRIVG